MVSFLEWNIIYSKFGFVDEEVYEIYGFRRRMD